MTGSATLSLDTSSEPFSILNRGTGNGDWGWELGAGNGDRGRKGKKIEQTLSERARDTIGGG
ncbi:hypothetical protein RRF57_004095 [Xylaria bambusicola]|uniref:Uncharacterized protein n=1 Tax=Xylaria bambusicola TaxID=326684 RepID=A0AAN7U9M5_9PEZI